MSSRVCLLFGTVLVFSQLLILITYYQSIRMLSQSEQDTSSYGMPLSVANTNKVANEGITITQQESLLVHLHIGKNGGTSLDGLLRKLAAETHQKYRGFRHFDWSYVETLNPATTHVFTMLRNPVQRAISHYYSAKIWMKNQQLKATTLQEYLNNTNLILQTRTIWMDGQAGVSWLTGTHTEEWVIGKLNTSEVKRREDMYTNATALCLLAADRLDQTRWFGILEELPESMELLRLEMGLNETPSLPEGNKNPKPRPVVGEWEHQALASLMPMDMWLYEYGKLLFEARRQAFKSGVFEPPERPRLPTIWSCISTEKALNCMEGPFKGSYRLQRYSVLRKKRTDGTNNATAKNGNAVIAVA